MIEETTSILKLKVSRRTAKKKLSKVILKGKGVLKLYQDCNKSVRLKKTPKSGDRIFSDEAYRRWREVTKMELGFIGNSAWITQFDNLHTKNITHSDEPLFKSFKRQIYFLEDRLNRIKITPKETTLLKLVKWFSELVTKVAVERIVDNTIGRRPR